MSAFDPAHLERLSASALVPVNGTVFRLDRPGDGPLFFERDAEDPEHVLNGMAPWVAELDGRTARVMTDPDFKGGQTGFMFVDGALRGLLVDGREYKVPVANPGTNVEAMATFWPAPEARRRDVEVPDIWKDSGRLRLWFDNPNKAGLLFAELALAFLGLLFLARPWALGLGLAGAAASFGCLLWTSSRGGFLSFLCGLGVLGLFSARRLATRRNLIVLAAACVLAVGGLFASGQGGRLVGKLFKEEQRTEEQRATSRLTIWREVPRMIVDAPGGWGVGKSAEAYIDWYRRGGNCLLKDMISGHLTLLVEQGWAVRTAYLLAWAFLLLFALLHAMKGGAPSPLALWTAFFVGACFNPVLAEPALLVLPLAFVVPLARAAVRRDRRRQAACALALGCAGVAVVAFGTVLAARNLSSGAVSVTRTDEAVVLNGTAPSVWIVDDDWVLHGGFWWLRGAEIRAGVRAHSPDAAVGYARRVADVPRETKRLVLVGEAGKDFLELAEQPRAKEVVFVSPPFTWREIPESLRAGCKVELLCGTLAARAAGLSRKDAPDWVRFVPGAQLYIPNWTDVLKF